jgi:glycosyltransferase involved in cell wall biosynthesis
VLKEKKIEDSFLVFSDDFGEHPSSCQHIFRHAPNHSPVLWVNTVGMRLPQLTARDFHKAVLKVKRMMYGSDSCTNEYAVSQIYVSQPLMLPILNVPGIQSVNKLSVRSTVNRQLTKLGITSPVVVVTAPNASNYLGLFKKRRTVYYCVDDFAEWPGLNKELVKQMDADMIRKSDIVVATSQKLFERLSARGKEVRLLTHGVDYEFFVSAPEEEHPLLRKVPKPRVGYFGLFDNRSNQDLIKETAQKMPDVSFVITGEIETDISGLKKNKNVYFTGSIPYKELPAMAKGWDVCMLPYKLNKLTDAIQPLKIKEYLATGKPVISTPIQEARKLDKYVVIAEIPDKWEKNIRLLLRGPSMEREEERSKFLEAESWVHKAEQFFEICTAGL